MRTNKTCYACLSFSSSALLAIFLQLECLFVFFARKAVYWIVFWKSNCLTFCRFIWKLIFWLLRRKVTQLFVFWLLDFLREKSKSRKIRKVSKSYFLTFWAVFSKSYFLTFCAKSDSLTFWVFFRKVSFWLFARKVTFWLFEFFFRKVTFWLFARKVTFGLFVFFSKSYFLTFCAKSDFLTFCAKSDFLTFWVFFRNVTFWPFCAKSDFLTFCAKSDFLTFWAVFSKSYFLTFCAKSDFLTFWVVFRKVTFWLFARKVTFWLFEFFFEKLLFDFLRDKLLFDFLTFCAKSAYSRSKAFLRRERRLELPMPLAILPSSWHLASPSISSSTSPVQDSHLKRDFCTAPASSGGEAIRKNHKNPPTLHWILVAKNRGSYNGL